MVVQPKYRPYGKSGLFADGRASRHLPPGVVQTEAIVGDSLLVEGTVGGVAADTFPFQVTPAVLARGRERFGIYCTPCHGTAGYGDGIVVQRGLRPPPSYHDDAVRRKPVGHYVHVMTHGYGTMASYADRVSCADRWAIAAWIRALQLSQHAALDELPAADRAALERVR